MSPTHPLRRCSIAGASDLSLEVTGTQSENSRLVHEVNSYQPPRLMRMMLAAELLDVLGPAQANYGAGGFP